MTVDSKKNRGRTDEDELYQIFTDEVKEAARDLDLSESVIRDGGDYRQHRTKEIFWLPLDVLVEFEQADLEIKDDQEFWDFFSDLIVAKQLKTKKERTKKESRSWGSWKSHWDDWQPTKISKWWSSWGYNSSNWGTGDSALTKQLLTALKAVTATVSVVNDTGHKFAVRLAQEEGAPSVAYTDFNSKRIVVSPQALLDTSIDTDVGIEVTTGWGLHEASHVKYTMSLLEALTQPTVLRPKSVAALLHNLLEDLRIESLTGEKFPGFKDYFTTGNDYLWGTMEEHIPKTWGPHLKEKVNAVIAMAKWPHKYEATALADPSLAAEYPWWREWAEGYVDGKEPVRMGVVRALERLAEDEDTAKEMEELTQQEEELESQRPKPLTDEEFKELLDKLKELLDNGIDPCPSPGHGPQQGQEIALTEDQAEALERLIEEQYQTFEATYKMHDGPSDVAPTIEVTRPQENDYTRMAYQKPGGMAQRLREVFYFRKKLHTDPERLLKSGAVDEEQLWRVGLGDTRVFEREANPEETFTSVTMLVDASGSMYGGGLEKAQELANVMLACLRTQRGVRARVRAHSTGSDDQGSTSAIYRVWEPGDPDTRLGLLTAGIGHGSNFDGFAIDWCARELFDSSLPGESMLLIVLSDGLPAGTITDPQRGYVHYGGEPAMNHMMDVSVGWGRKGVHIVQIAIDPEGIRPEDQARMFKHWVGYESDQKLLTDLTRILTKTFGGIE